MYYIVYEIENLINNKKYIGCHKTENIDDKYMGSGKILKKAIKKYGVENFKKRILYYLNNEDEMLSKEIELITDDIINSNEYYNLTGGGSSFKHINNNLDKYRHHFKNKVVVKDKNDNIIKVDKNDIRYINGELESLYKGYSVYRNKEGDFFRVKTDDERVKNGELFSPMKDMCLVYDKNNKISFVDKDDERITNGELNYFWTGRKHKEETKKKIGQKNSIYQKGEGNSQYGTYWIYNLNLKECKKIKNKDLDYWINNGWIKGRKMKFK